MQFPFSNFYFIVHHCIQTPTPMQFKSRVLSITYVREGNAEFVCFITKINFPSEKYIRFYFIVMMMMMLLSFVLEVDFQDSGNCNSKCRICTFPFPLFYFISTKQILCPVINFTYQKGGDDQIRNCGTFGIEITNKRVTCM